MLYALIALVHSVSVLGDTTTLTFPTLDLTAITANMQAFFSFMSPALWIVVGISLGGIIVGRLRGLL